MPMTNATVEAIVATAMGGMPGYFEAKKADVFWLLICGFLVFFMQCGFALLEAGTVRAKNTKNILLKNLLDACVGGLIWYSIGFMVAYDSGSAFIGVTSVTGVAPSFFLQGYAGSVEDSSGYGWATWFFQYVFAAAAATIVSGAMAERTALGGYIIYTCIITGFIYPVIVHWGWSTTGWFSFFNSANPPEWMLQDFAGSGIVHMTGGVAAFVGAAVVGPRTGRYDEKKKPLPMPGHSTTLQVMGTFILWLGWYGFNPGSTLGLAPTNYSRDAARAVVTTTLSAATGGVTVCLCEKLCGDKTWNVGAVCNGILGGLVSITAGCVCLMPWAAVLAGFIGGFIYFGTSKCLLFKCKVDDPLDAFAVHGACGFWGVLVVGLLSSPSYAYGAGAGLFYGESKAFVLAIVSLLAEVAFVGFMSFLMFFPLKKLGILRVSAEIEAAGMDVSKHGGAAYES